MKLNQIFAKPVDRYIEGVIKADDLDSLKLEIEEYVITNEIANRLSIFFDVYNEYYSGANGVWISGFFGSGKSHLLKMLALLLENQTIDGVNVLENFLPKCGDDAMLAGEMKRLATIPSRSILFNIDQKADVITTDETDAVLKVFMKVFDEFCGYYGKLGFVAKFERDLDQRDLLDNFKKSYQSISGKKWEEGREEISLEKDTVSEAYALASGNTKEASLNLIDDYRADYKVSIEDFAELVNDYIEKQEPGFRLNFFVDEIGQYIADKVKLMTNLQTIVESLATKCGERAWLIVTAQEDMDMVLGERGQQQTTDFSKIQDRFRTRIKLTNANVDEVIQRRLLEKDSEDSNVISDLSAIYQDEKNNFGTLLDFSDGSISYRNFRDEEHFINCYPFIPYQFSLFQSSIKNLSLHNAFEGKHRSVGARSMLGVFQEVVISITNENLGKLATYDQMFEGIRSTLKSQVQSAILTAEKHLDDDFAIRLLKALFLVKYVKEFKATPRNLRILMLDHFDQDLSSMREKVDTALSLLDQQTYIQRSGEEYEFLTNEEKDVEQEIKNSDVDSGEVNNTLQEILFSDVIRDRKIRYDITNQDFQFFRKVDVSLFGRE